MHMTIAITMPEHIEAHPADVLKSIAEAIRKPTAPQAAACEDKLSAMSDDASHTFRFRLGQTVTFRSAFRGTVIATVESRTQHRVDGDSYHLKWKDENDNFVFGTLQDEPLQPL